MKEMNLIKKEWLDYSLDTEDIYEFNHTYKDELDILQYICNGDTEKVRNLCENKFPIYPNPLGYYEQKNEEYMAVITIAIVSRSVQAEGITSAESFKLSDYFLNQIMRAKSISEILKIRTNAILTYTNLVAERQQSSLKFNVYVDECKQYIAANIFKKLRVQDIANSIGINSIYLERIFKENVGTSITSYILKEKIERSKNLLIYSDRSITEISIYLSFSSESHFGKTFKRITGKTPNQYRCEHHISGF